MELTVFYQLMLTNTFIELSMKIRGLEFGNVSNSRKLILLGHFVPLGILSTQGILFLQAFCPVRHFVSLDIMSFGHFILLGILSYLDKMSIGHFVHGHFVICGHFVTLGISSYNVLLEHFICPKQSILFLADSKFTQK